MANTENTSVQEGNEDELNEEDEARQRSLQLGGGGLPSFGGGAKPLVFLKDVRDEMRKVTWPTRRMVVTETIVVLVVLVFFFALLYGVDHLYALLFNWLLFGK